MHIKRASRCDQGHADDEKPEVFNELRSFNRRHAKKSTRRTYEVHWSVLSAQNGSRSWPYHHKGFSDNSAFRQRTNTCRRKHWRWDEWSKQSWAVLCWSAITGPASRVHIRPIFLNQCVLVKRNHEADQLSAYWWQDKLSKVGKLDALLDPPFLVCFVTYHKLRLLIASSKSVKESNVDRSFNLIGFAMS